MKTQDAFPSVKNKNWKLQDVIMMKSQSWIKLESICKPKKKYD
jgi:hypothetical protein